MKLKFSIGGILILAGLFLAGFLGRRTPPASVADPSDPANRRSGAAGARKAPMTMDFVTRFARAKDDSDRIKSTMDRRSILREWCGSDPHGAFEAWVDMNTGDPQDRRFTREFVISLSRELGYENALDLLAGIQDSQLRSTALQALAGEAGSTANPSLTASLLLSRAGPSERQPILAQAMHSWSEHSGVEPVAGWLDEHRGLLDAGMMAEIERAASLPLLESKPLEAVEWLEKRSSAQSLPDHLRYIVRQWASVAPNAAAEWLGGLPEGQGTDAAVAEFARTVTGDDPQSAATWAASITDPDIRASTLADVLHRWSFIDPQSAEQFQKTQPR